MQLPIHLVVVLTTIISTSVSITGGLVLYFESSAAVREIQKDVAATTANDMLAPFRTVFAEEQGAMQWLEHQWLYTNRSKTEQFEYLLPETMRYLATHPNIMGTIVWPWYDGLMLNPAATIMYSVHAHTDYAPDGSTTLVSTLATYNDHTEATLAPLVPDNYRDLTNITQAPYDNTWKGSRAFISHPVTAAPVAFAFSHGPIPPMPRSADYDVFGRGAIWEGTSGYFLFACHEKLAVPMSGMEHLSEKLGSLKLVSTICISFAGWQEKLLPLVGNLQSGAEFLVGIREAGHLLASSREINLRPTCGPRRDDPFFGSQCSIKVPVLGKAIDSAWNATEDVSTHDAMQEKGELLIYRTELFSQVNSDGSVTAFDGMWVRDKDESVKQINKALTLVIIFVVIVFVSDLILGFTEMFLLSRPLAILLRDLRAAASMNFNIDPNPGRGIGISEVTALRLEFLELSKYLIEYRKIMPAELFKIHETSDSSSDDNVASSRQATSKRNTSEDGTRTVSSFTRSARSTGKEPMTTAIGGTTKARDILHKIYEGRNTKPHTVLNVLWDASENAIGSMLHKLVSTADTHRGSVYHVGDGWAVITFGGLLRISQHEVLAGRCAMELARGGNVYCGLASGQGKVGMVTSGHFSSLVVCQMREYISKTLAVLARHIGVGILVAQGSALTFNRQVVDYISLTVPGGRIKKVFIEEILSFGEDINAAEWMYQLEEMNKNTDEKITSAIECLVSDSSTVSDATSLVSEVITRSPNNKAAQYWNAFLAANPELRLPYVRVVTETGFV